MHFDFPTFLVVATLATGAIWLIDILTFAPRRKRLAQAAEGAGGSGGSEISNQSAEKGYKEPLIVEYSRSFFPVILIVLILRSFLVEPFRIPSGSMMPTLLVGDFILVNKFAYGIRLPVVDTKIIEVGDPQRGDVVVFRFPANPSIDYIKRVVGMPGDRVKYHNKTLYINGKAKPQTPLGVYTGIGTGTRESGSLMGLERIDAIEHRILVHPLKPNLAPGCQVLARGPITVPEGHYFVMGDNRDNSNDSRCWGLVPNENLVGKAFGIWMNWDSQRPDFPIAWERLGNSIE